MCDVPESAESQIESADKSIRQLVIDQLADGKIQVSAVPPLANDLELLGVLVRLVRMLGG